MKLTRAEEEIMQIIWELDRCAVSDIRNYMESEMQVDKPPHSSNSIILSGATYLPFLRFHS